MNRVGVDVGGTFTDIVLEHTTPDGGQQVVVHKVPSTPADQSEAVVRGVSRSARWQAWHRTNWTSCSTAQRLQRIW